MSRPIKRIYTNTDSYEVSIDNVTKIELTEHGNKKTAIYKVAYDESILFVGLLEHQVEYEEMESEEE